MPISPGGSDNITTQNLVPAGAATANSAVEMSLSGAAGVTIQVTGTYTGALSLQGTVDGSNWVTLGGNVFTNLATGAVAATITSAATGIFTSLVVGLVKIRVTALAAVTGTAVVSIMPAAIPLDASALAAGANSIGTVVVAGLTNGTAIAPSATVGGYITHYTLVAGATTNAISVKTSAGSLGPLLLHNNSAAVKYLKLFNKASAPTVGTDTPVMNIPIPANSVLSVDSSAAGRRFSTGIAIAVTGGQPLLDATAVAAGDVVVNFSYV